MSFDFINGYQQPQGMGAPMPQYTVQNIYQQPMQQPTRQPTKEELEIMNYQPPKIVSGGIKFHIKDENSSDLNIPVPVGGTTEEHKRRGRPKKDDSESTEIIRGSKAEVGTVEDIPTAYTYMRTTELLRDTLNDIDGLNSELMQEFNTVKQSRTMKNKYNVMIGLSENIGDLINNKISAIKEINSCISKSNDLDYKKAKDFRAANANVDDDKYIADLYKSFITNNSQQQVPQYLQNAPAMDTSLFGSSGIIRATTDNKGDVGYLNYVSNLSPEQNAMRYEGNNNVKQVIVFDAATGHRFFQYMDMSTGQVVPNMPVMDDMFLEDFTIDLKSKTAKNTNLRMTMDVVVINEDSVQAQY